MSTRKYRIESPCKNIRILQFPILVIMYLKLAKTEEREALKIFGNRYKKYMKKTPAFIPNHLKKQEGTID